MESNSFSTSLRTSVSKSVGSFPFASCPVEVIQEILSLCDGGDIAKLFCCGDSRLNLKLQGPRTVLRFTVALDPQFQRKWPSVISYFHGLRKIEVKGTFPTHFEDIFGLPRTLESIEFSFWEAETCFALCPLPTAHATRKPPLPMDAAFVDMSLSFPSLKHLKLDGSGSVSDFFISTLPRALQTLHLSSYTVNNQALITEKCISMFPPDLTSLKMTAPFFCKPDHFARLPRSLTYLELLASSFTPGCVEALPSDLKALILPDNTTVTALDIQSLPASLEVLDICHNEDIDLNEFEHLPRSLKDLSIWRLIRRITGPFSVAPFVAQLPPGLTRLKIQHARHWSDAAMGALPRGLLHLTLHRVRDGLTTAFVSLLPRPLLSLSLFCEESYIEGEHLASLPPGLTRLELSCTNGKISDHHLALLPRSLVLLDMSHAVALTDACISLLPRGLTRLYFRHNNRLTGRCAPDLPRGLRYLSLSSCTSFSSASFKDLPNTLTQLVIPKARNIYGSDLKHLPNSIRNLDITSAPSFDTRYLPDLPTRILHGQFPTAELTRRYHALPMSQRRPAIERRLAARSPPQPSEMPKSWTSSLTAPLDAIWTYLWPFRRAQAPASPTLKRASN